MQDNETQTTAVTPEELADALTKERNGRPLALFLDYDGTLTPVVARPELAVLPEEVRATLGALAKEVPVAVISGRKRADVARLVGIDNIFYAGSHGFDIAGPGGHVRHQEGNTFVQSVAAAERQLRELLGTLRGAIVESKTFSVAVHYRLVDPADMPRIRAAVDAVLRSHPELRETTGKRVIDLRPRTDWDKGKAVLWLVRSLAPNHAGLYPVYIGDDVTDEDAFVALRKRGMTVLVAEVDRPSHARYRLTDVAAVKRFLAALLKH